jgi:hypothetical protein
LYCKLNYMVTDALSLSLFNQLELEAIVYSDYSNLLIHIYINLHKVQYEIKRKIINIKVESGDMCMYIYII